jgi:hypothetical protein
MTRKRTNGMSSQKIYSKFSKMILFGVPGEKPGTLFIKWREMLNSGV